MEKIACVCKHACMCGWKSLRRVAEGLLSKMQSFTVSEAYNLVVCQSVRMTSMSQLGHVPWQVSLDMLNPIEGSPFCLGKVYYNQESAQDSA